MPDRAEMAVFWIFAVPLIASAAGVVMSQSPVSAAMCLVAAFFFLAGIYVLLIAHLLAFLQVLIYAGAIMVLFVFVIMLLSPGEETFARFKVRAMHVAAVCGALGVMSVVVAAVMRTGVLEMNEVPADFGTVKAVGRLVYTQYLLPFEATSLLLLVAIVGAVVVAKRRI